jgi:ferredoxin-NADP reductase
VAVWRWRHAVATTPSSAGTPSQEKPDAAWAGWRDFRVARREYEDAAHSQCSFYFEPVDRLALPAFEPGQFLTFSLSIDDAATGAARTITRCYSLSDRPDPAHYRVTIKRIAAPPDMPDVAPGLSSNHFHDRVHEGDVLRIKAPSGHFFIDPDPVVPAVLVGGGIGIAPMMSMLHWCMAEQPARAIHLYYGVRCSHDHAFKRTLQELAESHPATVCVALAVR